MEYRNGGRPPRLSWRNFLEGGHGMAGWHRRHPSVLPHGGDHDAIARIFRHGKPGIIKAMGESERFAACQKRDEQHGATQQNGRGGDTTIMAWSESILPAQFAKLSPQQSVARGKTDHQRHLEQ